MDLGPLLALASAILKALAAFFWPKKENPDETALKNITDAKKIETSVFTQPAGDADDWLHKHRPKQ